MSTAGKDQWHSQVTDFSEEQDYEVCCSSVGKTVGIYVYVNGKKQLFTLESELRKQIAQEIAKKLL